jgi:ubiquitin-protein ligase
MDLLRAVIVGASGTPYHDGLFFFDIHLPADYPTVPPVSFKTLHMYKTYRNTFHIFVCVHITYMIFTL